MPEHGLKLQAAPVYKDMPEAPNSPLWIGRISPIAGREVEAEVLQENLVTVLPWCSSSGEAQLANLLPFTCRFLSMSQLASKSSSSSPKGLMSCSATCMWRAHSKGHHCHPCPFPCREKSGVIPFEFQAMFFFPKGGGLKVEAFQGLEDIRICNNCPLLTQPSCNFRSSFFPL